MAYTQTQLDALKNAVAKGVKSISYDGHSVTYNSLNEMRQVIKMMEREMGLRTGGLQVATPQFDRGI